MEDSNNNKIAKPNSYGVLADEKNLVEEKDFFPLKQYTFFHHTNNNTPSFIIDRRDNTAYFSNNIQEEIPISKTYKTNCYHGTTLESIKLITTKKTGFRTYMDLSTLSTQQKQLILDPEKKTIIIKMYYYNNSENPTSCKLYEIEKNTLKS